MKRLAALVLGVVLVGTIAVVLAQRGGGVGAPLRLDSLKLPAGFAIEVYAENVAGARSMALAPDGTLFVGTMRRGAVYAIPDRNKDFKGDEVVTFASGLNTPNGVAFRDGALYVAELNRIVRYDKALDAIKAPGAAPALTPAVVNTNFPSDRPHGWKYLAFGPDGLLYTQIGAPGNMVDRGDPYATIVRMKPDGSNWEIFARGVRNSVGMTWHPDTRELWFTDNGRDELGDERPNDELNVAAKPGLHFGYPYCHEGSISDPEFGKDKPCSGFVPPVHKLGPHVAALGLKFYAGAMFPAEYRRQLFIVNHGSWNRSQAVSHTGYRLMIARLKGTTVTSYDVFAEGWLQPGGREAWGRPVDLLELADGSLLVSDDRANVIYRITHKP